MAANLFARYVWLVDILRRHERLTYNSINQLWQQSGLNDGSELPQRMFHRHRAAIEDIFGVVIDCEKKPPYHYYIATPQTLERDGLRSWIIDTFAVDNLLRNNSKLRQRVLLEPIPNEGKRFLTQVMEAMDEKRIIEILYRTDYSPTAKPFKVAPYCLKIHRQRWYLVGLSDDIIKIFSLDRITACNTTSQPFKLPEDFSPQAFFADCFGIVKEAETTPQRIRLRFTDEQANYVRSLPIHPTQTEIERGVFEVCLCPTFDFLQFLFSQLDTIEVLSPQSLREQVATIAVSICRKYKQK